MYAQPINSTIAGEAWFQNGGKVIVNAGSGRFGYEHPLVTEETWKAACDFWRKLGYEVTEIPFNLR